MKRLTAKLICLVCDKFAIYLTLFVILWAACWVAEGGPWKGFLIAAVCFAVSFALACLTAGFLHVAGAIYDWARRNK